MTAPPLSETRRAHGREPPALRPGRRRPRTRLNGTAPQSEEEILRWLAGEYGLEYTGLDNVEPDRDILARFPARILLREEMLPLRQTDGHVEVALSRLFAAPGLDSLEGVHRSQAAAGPRPERRPPARDQETPRRRRGHSQPPRTGRRLPGRRRRPAGRRRSRQSRRRREHHPLRQSDPRRRAVDAHVGHPRRAVRARTPHPLPHRRPVAGSLGARPDQALPTRDCLTHQDSQQSQHRREARAAGRPHQDPREGQGRGYPCISDPDAPRRGGRDAICCARAAATSPDSLA